MTLPFHDLPTATLCNQQLELDYLTEAGPRVVRLRRAGSDRNLLAETPHIGWDTPWGRFQLLGGHRLWHAPEGAPRSAVPDNAGLEVSVDPAGRQVSLRGPVEPGTGLSKTIEIGLDPVRPVATLTHRLENHGLWPVRVSPWPITQLPLGGIAILPLATSPVQGPHYPNRTLAFWPQSRIDDPRFVLQNDLLFLLGRARLPSFKVGSYTPAGWVAHLHDGTLFVKRFTPHPGVAYPDAGCSAEVFCDERCTELETLGELVELAPGAATEQVETWEVYCDLPQAATPEGARAALADLGLYG